MKILYIANIRLPTEKAHGVQIMNMAHSFTKKGAHVELIVPKRFNEIHEDPFLYYGIEDTFFIKKFFCIDLFFLGWIGFIVQTFSFYISSFFYILSTSADVIYSRDPTILFLLSFFKKNIVWEVHTKKEGFVINRLLPHLRGLVCISAGLREVYEKKGISENKILVAHDAVDMTLFEKITEDKVELKKQLGLPSEKKIVSYVGKYMTMGMSKGVDELVSIFSQTMKKDPSLFFLFVGINKDEKENFVSTCEKKGLSPKNYSIVGHVPHQMAFRYLKASDIVTMNYPNIPHYAYYMSPLKLFEYMASGAAIISTDLPSIREVVTNMNNAILVRAGDTEEYVNKLLQLSLDSGLRDTLSINAAALVLEKYTWDKRAEMILIFLKR